MIKEEISNNKRRQDMPQEKNILDKFIEKELETQPNPFLSEKIMNNILTAQQPQKSTPILFRFAAAAGVAAVLTLGVFLGSTYTRTAKNETYALNINDTQIENLYLYDTEE
jgi:hypothetical protein